MEDIEPITNTVTNPVERDNTPIIAPTDVARRKALEVKREGYQIELAKKPVDDIDTAFRITIIGHLLLPERKGGGKVIPDELFNQINHKTDDPSIRAKFDAAIREVRDDIEEMNGNKKAEK